MNPYSYQKNSLSIRLKSVIFPIPEKIYQDYPIHLPFLRYFLKKKLNDEEHWILYQQHEMEPLWTHLRSLYEPMGHACISPFAEKFYNGRIESLFQEFFPIKFLTDPVVQLECLQWHQQEQEIQLAACADLANCLIYEWMLRGAN